MSPSIAMDYAAHLPLLKHLAGSLPVLQKLSRCGSWGNIQCSCAVTGSFTSGLPELPSV